LPFLLLINTFCCIFKLNICNTRTSLQRCTKPSSCGAAVAGQLLSGLLKWEHANEVAVEQCRDFRLESSTSTCKCQSLLAFYCGGGGGAPGGGPRGGAPNGGGAGGNAPDGGAPGGAPDGGGGR